MGSLSIACVQLGHKNCPLYEVVGCSLFRGCLSQLSVEVNGRAVGTFRIVRYIVGVRCSGVSIKRGSTVADTTQASINSYLDR